MEKILHLLGVLLVISQSSCQQQGWTKLVVSTGDLAEKDTEVFDFSPSPSNCSKYAQFPLMTSEGSGAYVDGKVTICGGAYKCSAWDYCHNYDLDNGVWNETTSLTVSRRAASSLILEDGKWWIAGGSERATSEVFVPGSGFSSFIDLPRPVEAHCLVDIGDGRYFFAAGYPFSNTAYILDMEQEEWAEVEPMAETRYGPICGTITRDDGETEVVVAGGKSETEVFKSTEIFSLSDMAWRSGPDLPLAIESATAVQFGDSFLAIGGVDANGTHLKTFYTFDVEQEDWMEKEERLRRARSHLVAIFVPDEAVECQ